MADVPRNTVRTGWSSKEFQDEERQEGVGNNFV